MQKTEHIALWQLKQLYNLDHVFFFEGNLYEALDWNKYRVIIRDDHYDYVEDKELIKRLNKFTDTVDI